MAAAILAPWTAAGPTRLPFEGEPAADYVYDVWQHGRGLPQNTVMAVVQGARGYLWLATSEGLARFDGRRFEVFDRQSTPQLRNNALQSLLVDRAGSLWIGGLDGLYRLSDGQVTVYSAADGLAHDDVHVLLEDRRGDLWIGTHGGLSRFDGESFVTYTSADGLFHDSVWALEEDRGGSLWIGTEGGLCRLDEGRVTSHARRDAMTSGEVRALHEDRRGRLWIGTLDGLSRLENGRFQTYSLADGLADPAVYALFEDHRGALWIGTDGGLNRLDEEGFATFRATDGLPDDRIRALMQDHEGSLWIGTFNGGLARLRSRRIRNFGPTEGLLGEVQLSVLQDRAGNVWIGGLDGLTRVGADGSVTTFTRRDGLPENSVAALYEDRRATLWIGTFRRGLARFTGTGFTPHALGEALAGARINRILEDAAGNLWIATAGRGLHLRAAGSTALDAYTADNTLPSDMVRDLYEDPRGVVWIATDAGLVRYDHGEWTRFDALARSQARTLYGEADGTLWIGTASGGLGRLRDGRFESFTTADGLFDNKVHRILDDGRGWLWMSSNKGIFRVEKQQLDDLTAGRIAAITSISYGEADGMRSSECNGAGQPAGWRTRDGRLWFPTIAGVAIVDPATVGSKPLPPPVVIEQVRVDRKVLPATRGRQVEIEPGARSFEFRYAALTFVQPEKARYKYRLEGFDDDWIDAGERRSAFYTNLAPGSYRFRVIARGSGGVWSGEGETFELDLRPAFHQTGLFYLASFLALAAGAGALYHLRIRHLLRRRLERDRIEILEAKNTEMERFTHTVSHDLKSPLITIEGFLGLLEKDMASGDAEQAAADAERIRGAVHTMQRLLDELGKLSRAGRVIRKPRQVPLGELAREAVELLAGRLGQSGVQVVIAPSLPVVMGDRGRLLLVFQNLIENAVKFRDPNQAEPRIEIGVLEADADVPGTAESGPPAPVIYVRDNGIGIARQDQRKIFGLFDQLDGRAEGSGMGLALVQRIVEVHGGRIWVESAGPGEGSTFCWTIG